MAPAASSRAILAPIEAWFAQQGWEPQPFQRQCWQAYLDGRSGLIQVPTGSGKTYAAVMGPLAELVREADLHPKERMGLRLLVITPLRALSRDLQLAIESPINAMGWPVKVGLRNGDTPSSERTRQRKRPPQILITTPESLALLLASVDAEGLFAELQGVVIDEWHELMGSKRGSQSELCLSWLSRQRPGLRRWAISATIGNLEEAARTAVGAGVEPVIITAPLQRGTAIRSLLPDSIDGFPWAGHLGLRMHETLVGGRRGYMPAFSEVLSGEQIDQLANYVAKLSGIGHDTAKASAGDALFHSETAACYYCHGANAAGRTEIGAPKLTDNIWLWAAVPSAASAEGKVAAI
ncbi:MAG: DEAD/DEAH box helicase, partial [Cyanobium sp.]